MRAGEDKSHVVMVRHERDGVKRCDERAERFGAAPVRGGRDETRVRRGCRRNERLANKASDEV